MPTKKTKKVKRTRVVIKTMALAHKYPYDTHFYISPLWIDNEKAKLGEGISEVEVTISYSLSLPKKSKGKSIRSHMKE